jgi:hypothetical protein
MGKHACQCVPPCRETAGATPASPPVAARIRPTVASLALGLGNGAGLAKSRAVASCGPGPPWPARLAGLIHMQPSGCLSLNRLTWGEPAQVGQKQK